MHRAESVCWTLRHDLGYRFLGHETRRKRESSKERLLGSDETQKQKGTGDENDSQGLWHDSPASIRGARLRLDREGRNHVSLTVVDGDRVQYGCIRAIRRRRCAGHPLGDLSERVKVDIELERRS